MQKITIGQLIQSEREMQKLSASILIEGIGTRQSLHKLESDQMQSDKLMIDLLLQRLGRSPDKLEYILSWKDYRLECVRDWFEECVFKKKRKWAERALELYAEKVGSMGPVQQMYWYRGRAMIAYWIDEDLLEAEQWLEKALNATFPRWKDVEWENCRISTMELENVLALIRVRQEITNAEKADGELLERCKKYIEICVTDGEENAKIYSKYAWVAANTKEMEDCPDKALQLCVEAVERLRQYSIEYFMRPLLCKILECQKRWKEVKKEVGCGVDMATEEAGSNRHYQAYLDSLCHLHEQFGENWYPKDSILHNCCQKSYHLDFEIIRAERYAQGLTQEMMADGVYENSKEIAKIENMRSSPRGKHFIKLMEKFGLEKGRLSGFVATDSFQVLELQKRIRGHINRHQYEAVKPLLQELEEQLDMRWLENRRVIQLIQNMIAIDEGSAKYEEMLAGNWEMLGKTYCLSPERLQESPEIKVRKGRKQTYRAPLWNESNIVNQIAILLRQMDRKEEAIHLSRWVLQTFEQSRVKPKYRYHSYGLLQENLAMYECSVERSAKTLRHELLCGKLGALGDNYLTMACALSDDSSNRERCRQMIRETYYLFELSNNRTNQEVVTNYYQKKYSERI